jgi:hypothetical protein
MVSPFRWGFQPSLPGGGRETSPFAHATEWEKEHMSEHESREPDPDERHDDTEQDEADRDAPDKGGNPWAKTSSGDKENVTSD